MTNAAVSALDRFRLDGRTAFLSGAAGHLGRAMALALGDAGARVILNGRNKPRLEDLANAIGAKGGEAEIAAFDVGDLATVRDFFGARERLDIIVNNAITMTPRPFAQLTEDEFAQTYLTGVTAPFEIVRAALPALKRAHEMAGDASIVNVASMYGTVAPDARVYSRPEQASPLHYGPAKAALMQLTRHLASELGREHIRVNALVPGVLRTELNAALLDGTERGREFLLRTPMKRYGKVEELGGAAIFLASDAASFVTGHLLVVDGGFLASGVNQ